MNMRTFDRVCVSRKGSDVRGLQVMEITMRLITSYELATKDVSQLRTLLQQCFNELAQSSSASRNRLNVLASIENVQRETAVRLSSSTSKNSKL